MPPAEFALHVDAYAGGSYPEDPRWLEIGGVRLEVAAVEARRREQRRLAFRVRLHDGRRLMLYYSPDHDSWSGAEVHSSTA